MQKRCLLFDHVRNRVQAKVGKVMHEFKRGELKSSSGPRVPSRKQAIAIGLTETSEASGKVPENPNESPTRPQ